MKGDLLPSRQGSIHPHRKRSNSPTEDNMISARIAIALALSLTAIPAQADVIYEDDKRICFDNGRCSKKMTEEEMDAAAEYLSPDEQREYQMLKDAARNPEALKKLLTTPYKPAVAPPTTFESLVAMTSKYSGKPYFSVRAQLEDAGWVYADFSHKGPQRCADGIGMKQACSQYPETLQCGMSGMQTCDFVLCRAQDQNDCITVTSTMDPRKLENVVSVRKYIAQN
jgi:hypothetical protein